MQIRYSGKITDQSPVKEIVIDILEDNYTISHLDTGVVIEVEGESFISKKEHFKVEVIRQANNGLVAIDRVTDLLSRGEERSERYIKDAISRDDKTDHYYYQGQLKVLMEMNDTIRKW